jgi:hypothetical protein
MNTKRAFKLLGIVILALAVLAALLGPASAQEGDEPQAPQVALGSGFTYQGYIERNGAPVSGDCDLQFALYDDPSAGLQVGAMQTVSGAAVSKGRFTVALNQGGEFGADAFTGQRRWLAIAVRCPEGSGGGYTTLSPRQELSAAPYALSLMPGALAFGNVPGIGVLNLANTGMGNGVYVDSAGLNGVYVDTVGSNGVHVLSAGGDGMFVCRTGDAFSCTNDDFSNGLEVGNAQHNGLRVDEAGASGVVVDSAALYGLYVGATGSDGVFVCATGNATSCVNDDFNNGLEVGNAEHNGLRVDYASASGVVVDRAALYGLHVGATGLDGVYVDSAVANGVYANTTDAAGEWGFYTFDKISASNVTAASFSLVAQVAPGEALEPGQVVAAVGLGASLPTSPQAVPLVALARDPSAGLAGVVESRLVVTTSLDDEGNERVDLHSDPSPAGPGDYVLLTVAGVAYVRVDPGASIAPGTRLAVSDGLARTLETREVEGMLVSEGAPALGTALEASSPDKPLVAVFVSLR